MKSPGRLFLFVAAAALGAAGCPADMEAAKYKHSVELLTSEDQDDRAQGAETARGLSQPRYVRGVIPLLIDRVDPATEVNPWARIYAAGALTTLTGQDFGSDSLSHERWRDWWYKEAKQKLPKREAPDKNFLEKTRADVTNKQGEIQLAGGNTVQAIDSFRKAIALDGTKALYHSNLGLALLKLGDYAGAERRFDDAIAADSRYVLAYLNKGALYADRAERKRELVLRIEAALREYRARGDAEKTEQARQDLTKVLDEVKQDEELALDTFRRVIVMDTEEKVWSAHASIGRIYMRRADFVSALPPLEQAKKLQRWDISVRRDLALTYFGLDQYYQSFQEIKAIEELGGKVDPDFRKKVEDKVKNMDENPL